MQNGELQILKQAIINEHEGYQFYRMAAEKAQDEEVRSIFSAMAEEEKEHEEWLRKTYKRVSENRQPVEALSPGKVEPAGVFTKEKLSNYGLAVSALHIGVMMEKSSIDHYLDAAKKTRVQSLKDMYMDLARWEQDHLDKLEKAYDFAREQWWESQNFSPA